MDLSQLRYFVAAAETSSMSRAAEREHVSQPALSRQVARLEQQLGVQLFERRKQRIHLTAAGRFLLPKARQLLCDAATAEQQLRERFAGARRTLRLGFVGPFLDDLVVPTVRELERRASGIDVALFDLPPRAQLDRLGTRELDAAILGNLEPEDRQRFSVRRLSRHRFAAVLPADHALANSRAVELGALRSERWVSLDDALFPGRREFLRAAAATRGFEPEIATEVESVSMMLGAVAAGDGVALAPWHSAKLPHAGAAFVKLRPPVPTIELALVTRPREPSPELDLLAELLQARARSLGDPDR
ncbi:MAG: LysR family transcriptional regulator [Planctomycetes bacterium]|nr:LysR family transcriptional regulator [Planctomycetota bacterium]